MAAHRKLILGISLAAILGLCGFTTSKNGLAQDAGDAAGLLNRTDDAVQTVYQSGVPHTDWSGGLRSEYEVGTSLLPLGIYYPEPCRTQRTFQWPRLSPSHPNYNDFVTQGRMYNIAIWLDGIENSDDMRRATYVVPEQGSGTQQRTLDRIPADHSIRYKIAPQPFFSFPDVVLASGTFSTTCPPTDADDSNVVETLANAGYNALITGGYQDSNLPLPLQHPKIYTDLMSAASVDDFTIIINSAYGQCARQFPTQLFQPFSQGGQGYSQDARVLGWQLEDEPLFTAAWQGSACDSGPQCNSQQMQNALNRITSKVNSFDPVTDQVIFAVEASDYGDSDHQVWPSGCNPGPYWEQFITAGNVGFHDNYPGWNMPGVPYDSTYWTAKSVSHQTEALGEARPSWYATQAFSGEGNGFPSTARARATVYTALVHGATGIWQFAWDSYRTRGGSPLDAGIRPEMPLEYPEQTVQGEISQSLAQAGEALWSTFSNINGELALLEPALLSPTSLEEYEVWVSHGGLHTSSPVHTMLKWTGGNDHYLLAVNMDDSAVTAEFRMPFQVGFKATLVGGGSPGGTGSVISDQFQPFGVKVYYFQYVQDGSEHQDTDGDGCSDSEELGSNPVMGGKRNPFYRWDFYDVTPPNQVDLNFDILGIAAKYGAVVGDPHYVASYDRGVRIGPNEWDLAPPSGTINLFDDILGAARQFGHDCRAPPN